VCVNIRTLTFKLGWWPEFNEHKWPSWCNKTKYKEFNETVIEPISSLMIQTWSICPSWIGTSNLEFWRHEWEKHGSCTDESVYAYFKHALNAYLYSESQMWFKCCSINTTLNVPDNGYLQCLIPFSKNDSTIEWLGYCHTKSIIVN
jgi:Ribonuclease T2 family